MRCALKIKTGLTFGNDFVEDVLQLIGADLHVLLKTHTHIRHMGVVFFSTEEAPQTK